MYCHTTSLKYVDQIYFLSLLQQNKKNLSLACHLKKHTNTKKLNNFSVKLKVIHICVSTVVLDWLDKYLSLVSFDLRLFTYS